MITTFFITKSTMNIENRNITDEWLSLKEARLQLQWVESEVIESSQKNREIINNKEQIYNQYETFESRLNNIMRDITTKNGLQTWNMTWEEATIEVFATIQPILEAEYGIITSSIPDMEKQLLQKNIMFKIMSYSRDWTVIDIHLQHCTFEYKSVDNYLPNEFSRGWEIIRQVNLSTPIIWRSLWNQPQTNFAGEPTTIIDSRTILWLAPHYIEHHEWWHYIFQTYFQWYEAYILHTKINYNGQQYTIRELSEAFSDLLVLDENYQIWANNITNLRGRRIWYGLWYDILNNLVWSPNQILAEYKSIVYEMIRALPNYTNSLYQIS